MKLIDASEKLLSVFSMNNPNFIAENILFEYNRIVDEIAPAKRVDMNKKGLPYIDEELKEMKKEVENRITYAIENPTTDEWRIVKHMRNQYSKLLDKAKTKYYKHILNTDYNLWRTIDNKTITTPTEIIKNGVRITSPKRLSNHMNKFF